VSGSLTLVGGGWGGAGGGPGGIGAAWRPFLEAAGPDPTIALLVVRDRDGEEHVARLVQTLEALGPLDARVALIGHGGAFDPAVLQGADGVLVGGGLTPAYLDAVLPLADRIRQLVDAGTPYAGFSAGAAIAARRAVVGGWRQDDVPVVDEEVAEALDPVTVRDGLGLTDLALDVHAAQWGTLARLITAVGAGSVDRGAAIDEDTSLVLEGDAVRVAGSGNVWWVEGGSDGVVVRRQPAAR
jgi:cyanophycinase